MGSALHRNGQLPRGMVVGTALVVAGTLALATLGHRAPLDPAAAGIRPTATRDLRFDDRGDGAVDEAELKAAGALMQRRRSGQQASR